MKRKQKPIEIGFSQNRFDQWRLSKVGGYIHIKPNGQVVFRFDTFEQYQEYLRLNNMRFEKEVQTHA